MNLKEIIEIAKLKRKPSYSGGNLYEDLTGVHEWISADHAVRLTEAYYEKWLCTDTTVGKMVYFLGDEAVATSSQDGRKCQKDFRWISRRTAEITLNYLQSIVPPEQDNFDVMSVEDLETDLGNSYFVTFGSELLTDTLYTKDNQKVTVVEVFREYNDIDNWRSVVVEFEDGTGTQKKMSLDELYIPYGE